MKSSVLSPLHPPAQVVVISDFEEAVNVFHCLFTDICAIHFDTHSILLVNAVGDVSSYKSNRKAGFCLTTVLISSVLIPAAKRPLQKIRIPSAGDG